MNKIIPTLIIFVSLFGNIGVSESADFQEGAAAYSNRDFATALRIWKPLAEQGNADAANRIGQLYRNGQGVPKDRKTAAKWYRLAAEEGHALGALNLAYEYFGGRGIKKNMISGYVWTLIALDSATHVVESKSHYNLRQYESIINKHVPRIKEGIKKELTLAQIAEAKKLAKECLSKKYKGC